ncbi:MAG TPA: WecB/TagA/CpsF family glycosyltransferase, partial [Gemmatimonadaceae bacterium]
MVSRALKTGSRKTILNANAFAITTAEHDDAFARALEKADVVFCDGYGVYVAARILGTPLSERFTYADWTEQLAATCRDEGAPMFLLGAREGVGED